MEQTERLEKRIDKNEEKINSLSARVESMDTRCSERHKISLTTQLKTLEVKEGTFEEHTKEKEEKLQKELTRTSQTLSDIQIGMDKRCKDVGELLDQLQVRVKTLQNWKLKKESFRQKLWFEILMIVIGCILINFITHSFVRFFQDHNATEKAKAIIQQIQK